MQRLRSIAAPLAVLFALALAPPAAADDAADKNAVAGNQENLRLVFALALTLDGDAGERLPEWLKSFAQAQKPEFDTDRDFYWTPDYFSIVFGNGELAVTGKKYALDMQRYTVRVHTVEDSGFGRSEEARRLAEAFSGTFAEYDEVSVSPLIPVWQPQSRTWSPVYRLDIALEPEARDRFFARLRTFARRFDYVIMGGVFPGDGIEHSDPNSLQLGFDLLGDAVLIGGSNALNEREMLISFYRNGPPESVTLEEVGRLADAFAAFFRDLEGVTLSGKVRVEP